MAYTLTDSTITDEVVLGLQKDVLSNSLDNNANMSYNKIATKNTSLNTAYFTSAANRKIVNALNLLYKNSDTANTTAESTKSYVANSVGDTGTTTVSDAFTSVKETTGKENLIEAVKYILDSGSCSFGGVVTTLEGLTGAENKIYFNSTDNKFYLWNGTEAVSVTSDIEFETDEIDFSTWNAE